MRHWSGIVLCATLMCAAGCSSDGKPPPKFADPVPTEGTVKLDGDPLVGAVVTFHPKASEGFQGAIGVTDANGKYVLETFIGDGKTKKGAIPGRYDVTVSRMVDKDGKPIKYDPNVPPFADPTARESIPMKYSTKGDEGLYYEVPAGGGKFDIDIFTK